MRVAPALLLVPLLLAACATSSGTSELGESSVEYLLIGDHAGRQRAPIEVVATRTVHSGAGVVRVEPIRRGTPSGALAGALASPIAARPGRGLRDADRAESQREAPRFVVTPVPGGPADLVLPYPVMRMFRGFGACRGDHHHHEAIDIGGVGPDGGVGTPIVAMARGRVTMIGTPEGDPAEFGVRDTRGGAVERGGKTLPRSKVIEGYGRVHFFTRDKGRWRSGVVVVIEGLGGTLDKHELRYMHLAAVHPALKVGDVVEAGQEIGLMGGTAVQEASPHLHLDIEAPNGTRLDVAPLLGLDPTARPCPEPTRDGREPQVWTRAVKLPACGLWEGEEDFASGAYYAHEVQLQLARGQRVEVALHNNAGRWKPKLEVSDGAGTLVYQGTSATRVGKKGPLKVVRKASGKDGDKAALVITAREDTALTVRVTAWPAAREGLLLPQDGSYGLSIKGPRCDD